MKHCLLLPHLVLLVLLLTEVTACVSRPDSEDSSPNISDISFSLESDSLTIVHPFRTDSGIVAVLPAYWDATHILYQKESTDWQSIHVEWGKATRLPQGESITFYQSQLNMVWITTQSGSMAQIDASLDKSVKEAGFIKAIDIHGEPFYNDSLKQIKGRGNSSWLHAKKPYNIQLTNKARLFDLHKSRKFCLVSSNGITDLLGLKIAEQFDCSSPIASCPVALYLNGNYNGLYLLTNKVEVAKSAVDITDLEDLNHKDKAHKGQPCPTISLDEESCRYVEGIESPEDLTGGYLIEVLNFKDRYASTTSGFIGGEDNRIEIKSPERASRDEVLYIRNLFNAFYFANKAPDGIHPETGTTYSDYIDLPSFARYYLVEEVLGNMDGGYGNLYFYKDRDSCDHRLYAGPIWDMGWSMGQDARYPYCRCPRSFFVRAGSSNERHRIFYYLFQHEDFRQLVCQLYLSELRPILDLYFSGDNLYQRLPVNTAHDVELNHMRWPQIERPDVARILSYMHDRIDYMDEVFSLPSEEDYCQVSVNAGFQHRNLMFLVRRGSTFELPTFDFWSPVPDAEVQTVDGWYDSDRRLDSNVQTIDEDKFYLLHWNPSK